MICLGVSKRLRRDYPEPPAVDDARWIQLGHGRFALVDVDDFDRVSLYAWSHYTVGYAARSAGRNRTVYLHRFIANAPNDAEVDHTNLDKLDCRKSNLRITNKSGNTSNRLGVRSATGYRGVFRKRGKTSDSKDRWNVQIRTPNGVKCISGFSNPEDAARAYDAEARIVFGGMARLNFPGPGELPARTTDALPVIVDEPRPVRFPNWNQEAGTRRCTKCGQTLPLSAFYKNSQNKSGVRPDCKECHDKRKGEEKKGRRNRLPSEL